MLQYYNIIFNLYISGVYMAFIISAAWQLIFGLIGIMGIGFLIGFHELGHFLFCKLFGIHTPIFSIGFGPKIFSKKIGQTEFILSAIPLGGYVQIEGDEQEEEKKETKQQPSHNSFIAKPYYQKMLVIAGGILFNMLFAYAALSVLFFVGMPKSPLVYPLHASTTIATVEKDSPATESGLLADDVILSINDDDIYAKPLDLIRYVQAHPNETITLRIKRNTDIKTLQVKIGEKTTQETSIGYLGIDFVMPRYDIATSIKHGFSTANAIFLQIFNVFRSFKKSFNSMGGPIMVISQTVQGAAKGTKIFLLLLAFISINLAALNVLPIPPMDGGRALFCTIEAVIGRELPEKIKSYIIYACLIGILLLALLLSIKDIARLIQPT